MIDTLFDPMPFGEVLFTLVILTQNRYQPSLHIIHKEMYILLMRA